MKKQSNQEIANGVFKKNPDAKEVFITSDGLAFLTKNSAELHANTNPTKKKLKVFSFEQKEETTTTKENKVVKLEKLNKADLIKVAESKGIRPDENATKAQIIEAIETLEKTKNNA